MPEPSSQEGVGPHDTELVARVRDGDASALESIFLAFSGALRAFAFRYVGSRDEAADLVQDVFLTLWRNRASWQVQSSLKAYLFRATRNAALDRLRHERVHRVWQDEAERDQAAAPANPPSSATDTAVLSAELRDAIERAGAALPERRRMAMLLRWRDGLSYAEIMGISPVRPNQDHG